MYDFIAICKRLRLQSSTIRKTPVFFAVNIFSPIFEATQILFTQKTNEFMRYIFHRSSAPPAHVARYSV